MFNTIIPKSKTYTGLQEFIEENSLQQVFKTAVTGDARTVEDYVSEYGETQDLTLCVINDISGGKWGDKIIFQSASGMDFTFKP